MFQSLLEKKNTMITILKRVVEALGLVQLCNEYHTIFLHYICKYKYGLLPLRLVTWMNLGNLNGSNSRENTPLITAWKHNQYEIMHHLLKHDANASACNDDGYNILTLECMYGQDTSWIHMLRTEFNIAIDQMVGKLNETPLHIACHSDNTELVVLLTDLSANVHAEDTNGVTPLWYALRNNPYNYAIMNRLLNAKSDPNGVESNESRITPLHYLCKEYPDAYDTIKYFLEYGGDPNYIEYEDASETIVTYLCRRSRINIGLLHLLLKNGANPNQKSYGCESALFYACKKGDLNAMRVLVNFKANIVSSFIQVVFDGEYQGLDKSTSVLESPVIDLHSFRYILNECIQKEGMDVIQYQKKYTIHLPNEEKLECHLFHYICYHCFRFIDTENIFCNFVDFLVDDVGFDINLLTQDGDTPLHYLQYGMSDYENHTEEGYEYFEWVDFQPHREDTVRPILIHMIEKGANPRIENSKKESIMSYYKSGCQGCGSFKEMHNYAPDRRDSIHEYLSTYLILTEKYSS